MSSVDKTYVVSSGGTNWDNKDPLLCHLVCMCCWRFFLFCCCSKNILPTGNIKRGSLCVLMSSSWFPCCVLKNFQLLLKYDTDNREQLYAFCIWLRKQPPALCIYIIPWWWWIHVFVSALSDSWGSIHGCFTEETGEQESVWVCGYVSLTSIALFHQWELDSTKLSSILMWSQEDFAAAKISSPFSLE